MNNQHLPMFQKVPKQLPADPDIERRGRLKEALDHRQSATFRQELSETGELKVAPAETSMIENALSLFDTTGADDPDTAMHLVQQANVLNPECKIARHLNITADLMNSIRPQDALEGMLASQIVACHNMAMSLAEKAMDGTQATASLDLNLNRSNKMMRLFGQHLETIYRMRQKGQQTIQVQHVHLENVNQVVVTTLHNNQQ
jgi:hypothetical protein